MTYRPHGYRPSIFVGQDLYDMTAEYLRCVRSKTHASEATKLSHQLAAARHVRDAAEAFLKYFDAAIEGKCSFCAGATKQAGAEVREGCAACGRVFS